MTRASKLCSVRGFVFFAIYAFFAFSLFGMPFFYAGAASGAACVVNGRFKCAGNTVAECRAAPDCSAAKDSCQTLDSSQCNSAASTLPPNNGGTNPPPNGPGVITATSSDVDCKKDPNACLYNPLPTGDLGVMFLIIGRGTLMLTGLFAVIFIIVGGFKMVMAQGDEEAYTNAKKTVTWAVLGLVVALLSYTIVAVVQNFLNADIRT